MPLKTYESYFMDKKLIKAFRKFCEKEGRQKSATAELILKDWLKDNQEAKPKSRTPSVDLFWSQLHKNKTHQALPGDDERSES